MSSIRYETLRESVAQAIRMKICNQELRPGERIVEQTLVEEFGVSRAPIREALRQLEQEGMVEYVRNAGCSVKRITLQDVYEIYLLRSQAELLAVRMCGGQFQPEEIAEMEAVLEYMRTLDGSDINELISCDYKLHRIIVKKSKLPRLVKSWDELAYGNIIAAMQDSASHSELAGRQYAIHCKIVDICRSNDKDAICEVLKKHYMEPLRRMYREQGMSTEMLDLL